MSGRIVSAATLFRRYLNTTEELRSQSYLAQKNMGTCSQAILSYGIIIPQSKVVSLMQALRNIPPSPNEPAKWYDNPENGHPDPEEWSHEQTEELTERLTEQLKRAGINKEEFDVETLGGCDEWEGQAVLYKGKYNQDSEDEKDTGLKMEAWGSDDFGYLKRLTPKPWENQELIQAANEAFKRLAEVSVFKGIEVAPDWLHGILMTC